MDRAHPGGHKGYPPLSKNLPATKRDRKRDYSGNGPRCRSEWWICPTSALFRRASNGALPVTCPQGHDLAFTGATHHRRPGAYATSKSRKDDHAPCAPPLRKFDDACAVAMAGQAKSDRKAVAMTPAISWAMKPRGFLFRLNPPMRPLPYLSIPAQTTLPRKRAGMVMRRRVGAESRTSDCEDSRRRSKRQRSALAPRASNYTYVRSSLRFQPTTPTQI